MSPHTPVLMPPSVGVPLSGWEITYNRSLAKSSNSFRVTASTKPLPRYSGSTQRLYRLPSMPKNAQIISFPKSVFPTFCPSAVVPSTSPVEVCRYRIITDLWRHKRILRRRSIIIDHEASIFLIILAATIITTTIIINPIFLSS